MDKLLNFFTHDWYIAIPLLLMSLVAIFLIFWRIMLNSNGSTRLDEFLPLLQKALNKEGVEGALKLCRSRVDLIPKKLFVAGLESAKQGLAPMRRSMASTIELEILPDLNYLLPTMLAIAKIATMVGLLGTVISMINVFGKIQDAAKSNDASGMGSHSGEIGLALFATALGLITAIPLVFSHVLFKAWISRFEVKMKSSAQKLLVLVQNLKQTSKDTTTKASSGAKS